MPRSICTGSSGASSATGTSRWSSRGCTRRRRRRDARVSAMLLYVLEETLALAHPIMPFVTEEIYAFMPARKAARVRGSSPVAEERLIDDAAEREVEAVIEAMRSLRRYRETVGRPPRRESPARIVSQSAAPGALRTIARRRSSDSPASTSRSRPDGAPASRLAPSRSRARPSRCSPPRTSIPRRPAPALARAREHAASRDRAVGGQAREQRFVEKAPGEIVQQERDKLDALRARARRA